MAEYRKRPVVVEAFQMTRENFVGESGDWPDWAQRACEISGPGSISMHGTNGVACTIVTLEGSMDCAFDDWIIRGVRGELYPCKPDIFEATYQRAESQAVVVQVDASEISRLLEERLRELSPEVSLAAIVSEFVEKHNITCAETIYQTDRVIEDATTLIEKLVNVVGYVELEEDEL